MRMSMREIERASEMKRAYGDERNGGKETWQPLCCRVNQAINDYIVPNANTDNNKNEANLTKMSREERLCFIFRTLLCVTAAAVVHVSFSSSCALLRTFFACLETRHVNRIEFIVLKRICVMCNV